MGEVHDQLSEQPASHMGHAPLPFAGIHRSAMSRGLQVS